MTNITISLDGINHHELHVQEGDKIIFQEKRIVITRPVEGTVIVTTSNGGKR